MPATSTDQPTQPDSREDARALLRRIGAWAMANAVGQKFQIENAMASKAVGKPIEFIPFGNVSVQLPSEQGASSAPASSTNPLIAAALGAALGVGGFGLASHLNKPDAPSAEPIEQAVENIPLTIQWEFTPDGQRATDPE